MAVDSALTPPLSLEEKKEKKIQKKLRKEARRAAEALHAVAGSEEVEEIAPVVGEKRKAEETAGEELVKVKKSKKKSKDVVEVPAASTSTVATPATKAECEAFLAENNISHEPEEAKDSFAPILSFASLPIEEGIRKGLSGYAKPTPIQSASFPVMMGGRDVVGIAETGYVSRSLARSSNLTKLRLIDLERPSHSVYRLSNIFSPSPRKHPRKLFPPFLSSSSLPLENSPCKLTPISPPFPPLFPLSPPSVFTVEFRKTTKRKFSKKVLELSSVRLVDYLI